MPVTTAKLDDSPQRECLLPNLLIGVGLQILTAIVYLQVQQFPLVNIDDPGNVTQNPHVVAGLNLADIRWAFGAFWMGHWAPLTWISFQFDSTFFHLNPGIMHLENAGLHVLTTLLLFAFLALSTGKRWPGVWVAALFAVHPVHVESVAWITERRDMMSGPPFMASLITYVLYTRASRRPVAIAWYAFSIVLFFTSLLGKATAVTLPLLMLLVDLWPLGRIALTNDTLRLRPTDKLSWQQLILEKLPFLFISAAVSWAAVRAQAAAGAAMTLTRHPLHARLANAVVCYALYIWKFAVPIHLAFFYPLHPWPAMEVVAAAVILIVITAWVLRRPRPVMVTGWFWFLIMLLPVIGLFQSGLQSMADRYLYLPLIGLGIMVMWGLAESKLRRWLNAMALVIVVILAILSYRQTGYWHSTRELFDHSVRVLNDGPELHIQLARLDVMEGNPAGAKLEYENALRMDRLNFAAEFDLGNLLQTQPSQAIPHYLRALELRPRWSQAENNLAVAYVSSQQFDLAESEMRSAIRDDPDYADPHANLGMLMLQQGRRDTAEGEFTAALKIEPGNPIAVAGLLQLERSRDADRHLSRPASR